MTSAAMAAPVRRDATVIGLVSAAHFMSHMMQLTLAPLFPLLHQEFGVNFKQLGLLVTVFYVCSAAGQALAGVLVDRYGAARVLLTGLSLLSLAIGTVGLVTEYWMLLPLAALAGLGNSVFHPADLSILSHRVRERLLGRAYAIHGVTGSLGYAAGPVAVTALLAVTSWRTAVITVGLVGLSVAVLLMLRRNELAYAQSAPKPGAASAKSGTKSYLAVVTTPALLLAFGYFMCTAFTGAGLQNFAVTAFVGGYGMSLDAATLALTAYLGGAACGMVLGGFLADRTQQHHLVAMTGVSLTTLLLLAVAALPGHRLLVPAAMALAGCALGATAPSRDILIRRAATGAGMGSVFGFVYSGFDVGSSTAPLLFGALSDHHAWQAVFVAAAVALAIAVPTVMQVQRRGRTVPSAAG